jgi:hypothetical protein
VPWVKERGRETCIVHPLPHPRYHHKLMEGQVKSFLAEVITQAPHAVQLAQSILLLASPIIAVGICSLVLLKLAIAIVNNIGALTKRVVTNVTWFLVVAVVVSAIAFAWSHLDGRVASWVTNTMYRACVLVTQQSALSSHLCNDLVAFIGIT